MYNRREFVPLFLGNSLWITGSGLQRVFGLAANKLSFILAFWQVAYGIKVK